MAVWFAMFKKIGLYYYMWGLLTPFIYRMTNALPYRGRTLVLTITIHLGVLAILSFSLGTVAHYADWQAWMLGPRALGYHSMSAFTYALIVLCCLSLRFYRLSVLREREASAALLHAEQLDNRLNQARVDSLRMQLNPHFLFNALNSIAALIDSKRSDAAYEALEQLGELLRHALRLSKSSEISLEEELEFCRAYLALEQVRFDERLAVVWHIDPECHSIIVPAFILQPLVENAIKHAVSASTSTVTVTITARTSEHELNLLVSDDGQTTMTGSNALQSGVGLDNLRERLELRYGRDASLEARSTTPGFETHIRIGLAALRTSASN